MDLKTDNHRQVTKTFSRVLLSPYLWCPQRADLVTNAASRMAIHTSRNGTSLVNVYPCSTRGSALIAVEADVHGVGKVSVSPVGGGGTGEVSLFLRSRECGDKLEGMCGRKRWCLSSPL